MTSLMSLVDQINEAQSLLVDVVVAKYSWPNATLNGYLNIDAMEDKAGAESIAYLENNGLLYMKLNGTYELTTKGQNAWKNKN